MFRSRLRKRSQNEVFDLSNYTFLDVIEGIEAARKRLGYERVNLFSGSYGTRLAMMVESTSV